MPVAAAHGQPAKSAGSVRRLPSLPAGLPASAASLAAAHSLGRRLAQRQVSGWAAMRRTPDRRTQVVGALVPATAMLVVAALGWSIGWSFGVGSLPLEEQVLGATATPPADTPTPTPNLIIVRSTPAPSPTAAPTPSPTPRATPGPTERAVEEPTAAPTAKPTPKPTPTSSPLPRPTPAPTSPGQSADDVDPTESVTLFYDLAEAHSYTEAAALWSPAMQAQYPIEKNLERRFARTTQIDVVRAEVISLDEAVGLAVVDVQITEYRSSGRSPVTYTGSWDLIWGTDSWLLDEPHFTRRPF